MLQLGLKSHGSNYHWLKELLNHFNIIVNFSKYDEKSLRDICRDAISMAQVLEKLNLSLSNGNHATIRNKILEFGIDISHWTGQYQPRPSKRKGPRTLEDILQENTSYPSARLLKRLVTERNWVKKCCFDDCPTQQMAQWRGQPLKFELDHINGIRTDNREGNLRIICCYCHKYTETYGSKNSTIIKKPSKPVCLECGSFVSKYGNHCKDCKKARPTKIEWPSDLELLQLVKATNLTKAAKILSEKNKPKSVTDNAVKKRLIRKGFTKKDWKS